MLQESPKDAARAARAAAFHAAIDALLVFYAPDVVCYPAKGWVQEAVCHGHEGIRKLSAVWTESMDDASLAVHEVRDMHERVLILAELTGRAKASGAPMRQPFGVVNSDLRDDGTVGEVRFFLTWQEALESMGLTK
jgi:ketosteroid isomerase-like protein